MTGIKMMEFNLSVNRDHLKELQKVIKEMAGADTVNWDDLSAMVKRATDLNEYIKGMEQAKMYMES